MTTYVELARDTFARANEEPLRASDWETVSGFEPLKVASNVCIADSDPVQQYGFQIWKGAIQADQYVEVTLGSGFSAPDGFVDVTCRSDAVGNCYFLEMQGGVAAGWAIFRFVAPSTDIEIISGADVPADGDKWRLEIVGSVLTAKKNGVTVGSTTDSHYASGNAALGIGWGVAAVNTSVALFTAGEIVSASAAEMEGSSVPSEVEIVNHALLLLGEKTITSLADNTVRASIANSIYALTRNAVLRAHPWSCAISRATLSPLSTAPSFGWKQSFPLPTDPYCLRVLALNDDQECGEGGDTWKVEGRNLLTNTGSANIRYIGKITDVTQYDALLYQALAFRLASAMAFPITGKPALSQQMWQFYSGILQEARTINGQEGTPDANNVNTLSWVR